MAKAAASLSLNSARGAHPTVRLDAFMRSTDPSYQMGTHDMAGQHFVRKMGTCGRTRPDVAFTNESRAARPFLGKDCCYDMSSEPPIWNDSRADPREGTLVYPEPPEVNMSWIELYKNDNLMLPSERFQEHLHMKSSERKWRADRAEIFFDKKRKNMVERHHKQGVVGIDSPMHPDTHLYAGLSSARLSARETKERHSAGRHDHLGYQTHTNDATAARDYGLPPPPMARSADIPVQRKRIDPNIHPFRFLDTHDRLHPHDVPYWDRERAKTLRSHDARSKTFNIITGEETSMSFGVRDVLPP